MCSSSYSVSEVLEARPLSAEDRKINTEARLSSTAKERKSLETEHIEGTQLKMKDYFTHQKVCLKMLGVESKTGQASVIFQMQPFAKACEKLQTIKEKHGFLLRGLCLPRFPRWL